MNWKISVIICNLKFKLEILKKSGTHKKVFLHNNLFLFIFRGGAFIITICSMKLLRHCYCDTPRQFPMLAFTLLCFTYDFTGPEGSSNFFTEYFVLHYFFMTILLTKVSLKFAGLYYSCLSH